jgi:hypothetical protein
MGQKLRWWPDTCGCRVLEDLDGGVFSCDHFESKCAAHASLTDAQAYDVILLDATSEQRRKNKLQGFLEASGIAGLTETDAESGAVTLKKGIKLNWSWSGTAPNRVITVWITGFTLTAGQKATAQTWCNNQFGAGKVVIA